MSKITGKPTELKKVNTSLIMNSIKTRITATRAEIVKDTEISHTTVRVILKELIEENEIIPMGLDESSGGRRAERYKINSNKRCVLAISIEKSKVLYGVVNILGEVLEENSQKVSVVNDTNSILKIIDDLYKIYPNIKSIGISVPGIVTENGYLSGRSLDNLKEIQIKKQIQQLYNIPVVLENDLNAVALAFYKNHKEINNEKQINLTYLRFTTLGAGAGIIVNGQLLKGNIGYSGEIGIMPMGNSCLNDILFDNLNDVKYCNIIVDTIKIITSILNPKLIVLGGNDFRYELSENIIDRYNTKFNIPTDIIFEDRKKNYALLGITQEALNLINEEVKLVNIKL